MKKISEEDFELKFEEIQNEKIEVLEPKNNTKKEKNMKKFKQINWNKIIETIKTIIIVILIALPIGFYFGVNYQKIENQKIVETVKNLSQNK